MSDAVDPEIEAIRNVLAALHPLSEKARASVLDYVTKRLEIVSTTKSPIQSPQDQIHPPLKPTIPEQTEEGPIQIKKLKEEKKPRSANEMTALIAYFLANLAPPNDRKDIISQKEIETYFKIAKFPLPRTPRVTLPNAKNAGYFDLASGGGYKLNAVGYNLVVHSMPRGTTDSSEGRRAQPRKPTTKPKKKTSSRRKSRNR